MLESIRFKHLKILQDTDIAFRDEFVPTEGIVSVSEAAEQLGITRSAVVNAAQAARVKGKKIGKT